MSLIHTKVVGKQKLDVTQLLSNEFLTNGEEEMMMMVAADISRIVSEMRGETL